MQNPFTTTFSKKPESTYIATGQAEEIIDNFSYESPTESVYKITGVRGSGKTVILADVEEKMRTDERMSKEWIICDLSPARDMLSQLAAMLHKEGFGETKKTGRSVSINASILGTGGGASFSEGREDYFFDIGVELESMIEDVKKKGKKLFIGIDEVSKTKEMIVFASEFGRWLRASYPVYLVCTGLYENVQELCNVKNLTFFRRATTIKTEPLNMVLMTEMYRHKLNLDIQEAKEMAHATLGYAYAFQKLGALCFLRKDGETIEDLLPALKAELFAYSYEKIWEEMPGGDRFLASLMLEKVSNKREDILKQMGDKAGGYSVYRDRLLKRGIISARQGYIEFALPYFAEYVKEYCQ